jgi:hypothetical protein
MTEQEWFACTDPAPMLQFIRQRATDRQLRMFVLACCRSVWGTATDEATRYALSIANEMADTALGEMTVSVSRILNGRASINCGASIPYEPVIIWVWLLRDGTKSESSEAVAT